MKSHSTTADFPHRQQNTTAAPPRQSQVGFSGDRERSHRASGSEGRPARRSVSPHFGSLLLERRRRSEDNRAPPSHQRRSESHTRASFAATCSLALALTRYALLHALRLAVAVFVQLPMWLSARQEGEGSKGIVLLNHSCWVKIPCWRPHLHTSTHSLSSLKAK